MAARHFQVGRPFLAGIAALFQFDSKSGRTADNGAYAGFFPGDFKEIVAIRPLDDIGRL